MRAPVACTLYTNTTTKYPVLRTRAKLKTQDARRPAGAMQQPAAQVSRASPEVPVGAAERERRARSCWLLVASGRRSRVE
jgi:hypothetical protein